MKKMDDKSFVVIEEKIEEKMDEKIEEKEK